MCNIAGYAGTRRAAPILIDMLRKEEGLNAGYYTGMATIHEGKIYYAKITGDLQHFLDQTDAADFPGTIGIIHSRTNSGGDDNWSHPFIGYDKNGQITSAYVANGSFGCFALRKGEYNQMAIRLEAEGYPMNAHLDLPNSHYPHVADGSAVHMSDVMCQLIQKNIDQDMPASKAMAEAFCTMPSAIVGLLLSLKEPDRINYSRINAPMSVGFAPHGAYMASAALVFPSDAGEPVSLPACSSGFVTKDTVNFSPYQNPPVEVAPIDARVRAEAYRIICDMLKESPKTFPPLVKAILPLFTPSDCPPAALAAYEILYSLQKQGVLHIDKIRKPGTHEGLQTWSFELHI